MIQEVLVAVYGSLRKGMGNHRLIEREEGTLLSTERIKGWEMYSYGGFPFIRPAENPEDEITIEVYAMPVTAMQPLDRLEGYPSFYDRKLVDTSKGKAWIYFIDQKGNDARVTNGDWVDYKGRQY